jgi:transposase
MSHDYIRNGTTSLFAAFDVSSGSVIAHSYRRHRHQEFLKFLKLIDAAVPKDLDLHLVLDNYATHKTQQVKAWLIKHPRFHLHFTPTSSSWLNLVERWFAELTNRKLRRSPHRSVAELEADIRTWINHWNADPKPFVWTKTAVRAPLGHRGEGASTRQRRSNGRGQDRPQAVTHSSTRPGITDPREHIEQNHRIRFGHDRRAGLGKNVRDTRRWHRRV